MLWLALTLGVIGAAALGVVAYAGSRMGRLPEDHPAAVIASGGPPSDPPVIVCLGDSITQGGLGADWVGMFRRRLADAAFVVNAGVGGQITWDLRQRLDEVTRCRPAAIVLMVGSNDAVGTLGGGWASFYKRGRPQAPSEAWFTEQFDALVTELVAITPWVVCLTLPPLGEDPTTQPAAIVRRLNDVIRERAAAHGADLLDINAALLAMDSPDSGSPRAPFLSGIPQFIAWALGSNIRHHLFGRSWDAIGRRRGLVMSTDTIHPNDRAAEVLADRVEGWARRTLDLHQDPRAGEAT